MKNFTSTEEKLSGVLVCDKNGLTLTSLIRKSLDSLVQRINSTIILGKDVAILPGPVGRLAELGSTLLSQRAIISLEHDEK